MIIIKNASRDERIISKARDIRDRERCFEVVCIVSNNVHLGHHNNDD